MIKVLGNLIIYNTDIMYLIDIEIPRNNSLQSAEASRGITADVEAEVRI
jgi:hypothetical protein